MSAREFAEWQAYSLIEPFGERRADQRAWLQVALHSNINRDPKKGKPVDLEMILPDWRPPPEPQAPEHVWRVFDQTMRGRMRQEA